MSVCVLTHVTRLVASAHDASIAVSRFAIETNQAQAWIWSADSALTRVTSIDILHSTVRTVQTAAGQDGAH